jgi:hypothetical protein
LYASDVALAASEVTALKVLDKFYDPQTQQLGYELWNESDKTITAWRLSLARSDPHGHAQSSILDQDFFDRSPAVELGSRLGPIAPGASLAAQWHVALEGEDSAHSALSLKVSAVVFEDRTFEGEPDAASGILAARVARVEEIGRVLTDLETQEPRLRSSQEWSAALKQRARLLKQRGADPESSNVDRREAAAVLSATQLELAQWLEDASREIALSTDPAAAVGFLTGSLRERYESGLRATVGEDQAMSSGEILKGGER